MPFGWDVYDWRGERDLENYPVWVCNIAHSVPAFHPFYSYMWHSVTPSSIQYGAEIYSQPRAKGWDARVYNGYTYITAALVTSEDEVKRRESLFRQKMMPVMDDPWGHWNKLKAELKGYYAPYRDLDPAGMNDIELLTAFRELRGDVWRRVWEIHMDGVYSLWGGGILPFRAFFAEVCGMDPSDTMFGRMLSGFDSSVFQLNKGLAQLAKKAVELRVEDNFKLGDEQVLPAMEQSEAGKAWLVELRDFLRQYGLRMEKLVELSTPTWVEKPSMAVPYIRQMIAAGGLHPPDLERERLRVEGEELEKELLDKIPKEQREWCKKLLTCAQAGHHFSEDHSYWCEFIFHSLLRLTMMELARRFVQSGVMGDPEDIHYLLPDQVVWAGIVKERVDLRPIIERNKAEHNHYLANPPISEKVPLFIGDPSRLTEFVLSDAAFGVVLAAPVASPEEVGATCVGAASAPGVVEGVARVVFSSAQLKELQPGEILVAPFTDATWTPVFGIVKGVVTDAGGILAHAAIVGREYGIPTVVGTQTGTQLIKTGDRIRVDGNLLRVYVLG